MAKELIVSVNGREKKIAIIENDQVTEFYIERGEENQGIVGNIYKGRVMRVLPGMQSAFVDVGLERDAFLYVSDFFDEEEEFERIVIDKSKKGEADVGRAAAEQIPLQRVERERQIEATHERAEPLGEAEPQIAAVDTEAAAEAGDGGRRRSRRGRRRGRGRYGQDAPIETALPSQAEIEAEQISTPFVASDPSIQRIVDEEETAAVNGEMFKDARLQERIFDQIHAVEFNLADDFHTAEVGSLLPAGGYRDVSFQRIDDGADADSETLQPVIRRPETIAAHLEGFVDRIDEESLHGGSFERISDDEETGPPEILDQPEPEKQADPLGFAARAVESIVSAVKGKRSTRPTRSSKAKTATKKTSSKRRIKDKDEDSGSALETTAESGTETSLEDTEARITGNRSRGEFATRRGGRRRRRPAGKTKRTAAGADESADANGKDEETEAGNHQQAEAETAVAAPETPAPAPVAPERERETGGRSSRGQQRRDRQQPAITDLLDEGQEILVQIAKEPIAKKGARITSH
ncbi:MAG: hypothetical protein ACREBC_03720, partial [Pyrinomonadaceae bacterium]